MLEIGKKIKVLRRNRDWSQGEVAAKIGLSTAAFSKIENGMTDVSISRLQQLANLFEVPLSQLILEGSNNDKNQIESPSNDKEIINIQRNKIVELQEYIISLYEQLHQTKAETIINQQGDHNIKP